MKYDQEIEREIEIEADDMVNLLQNRESVDDGTRVFIRPTELLHALARLDPMPVDPEERERLEKEYATESGGIQTVLMEDEEE